MVSFVPQHPNINCALLLTRIGLKKKKKLVNPGEFKTLGKSLNLKMSLSGYLLSVTFYRHNLADSTSGHGQFKISIKGGKGSEVGEWVGGSVKFEPCFDIFMSV